METPCLWGTNMAGRKLKKKQMSSSLLSKACSRLLRAHKLLYEYLFSYRDCSDCEISADKSLF